MGVENPSCLKGKFVDGKTFWKIIRFEALAVTVALTLRSGDTKD